MGVKGMGKRGQGKRGGGGYTKIYWYFTDFTLVFQCNNWV